MTTRSGVKYVGILSSTSTPTGAESEPLGAVLSCAQQIFSDGALGPLKKMLVVKGEDLDGLSAKGVGLDVPVSMSTSNRAGFRTDTEISKKALEPFGEGRALQKWADDVDDLPLEAGGGLSNTGSSATGGWDQFAANEARFGVKSNYEETLYTTKLDKSSKDYKERERKADQLAKEIMGVSAELAEVVLFSSAYPLSHSTVVYQQHPHSRGERHRFARRGPDRGGPLWRCRPWPQCLRPTCSKASRRGSEQWHRASGEE